MRKLLVLISPPVQIGVIILLILSGRTNDYLVAALFSASVAFQFVCSLPVAFELIGTDRTDEEMNEALDRYIFNNGPITNFVMAWFPNVIIAVVTGYLVWNGGTLFLPGIALGIVGVLVVIGSYRR